MKNAIQRGTAIRSGHDPRTAALRIIDRVLSGQEASQAVLDQTLRESSMVPSDKRLCTELVYGYLRWAVTLQWEVGRRLKKPEGLPPEMILVLGLAAYEILHLSRIPAHASVNWAVNRVRHRFGQGLANVANGVLRTVARDAKAKDPTPLDAVEDPVQRAALAHGLPEWIVRMWEEAYGTARAELYCAASSGQSPPAVRINACRDGAGELRNSLRAEHQGVAAGSWGVAFPNGLPYAARDLAQKGRLSLQSGAVQESLAALGLPGWRGPVWDVCAGRGGKTTAMLEAGLDVRLATDNSTDRLDALPGEVARLGLDGARMEYRPMDVVHDPLPTQQFATIVADAPCSGLGTLSRRPEIRFRRTAEDIAVLAEKQKTILSRSAQCLAANGTLIYMTCTLCPQENEAVVRGFLEANGEFSLDREWSTDPTTPWREFMYGAVLVKKAGHR